MGTTETNDNHLANERYALVTLLAVRCFLIAMALISASFYSAYAVDRADLTAPLVLLLSFLSLNVYWFIRKDPAPSLALIQGLVDVGYVTVLLYLTGGASSPFCFLYLPVVIGVALLTSRNGALLVALVSFGLYFLVGVMFQWGWFSVGLQSAAPLSDAAFITQELTILSSLVLIAIGSSYVRVQVRELLLRLYASESVLEEMKAHQSALVAHLDEGIVSTDSKGVIRTANEQARALLYEGADPVGISVGKVLKPLGISTKDLREGGTIVTKINEDQIDGGTTLEISGRKVVGTDGTHTGYVYVLRDTTHVSVLEEQIALQQRFAELRSSVADQPGDGERHGALKMLIGEAPVIQKVCNLIERVAPSNATVLIYGESGTGKELVARGIHRLSARANQPFIALNCGAIPEHLIESELFGHTKGAFTGADAARKGLFLEAEGGTLFLDEIGELPLQVQARLLRALQEKKIRQVGSDVEQDVDVRIISATNRNLRVESQEKRFREDLYFRLNVITLSLPPLRERRGDIPLLINHFLSHKRNAENNAPLSAILPSAMQLLQRYDYPGNVRELENIIERATVLGGDVILPEHLPEAVQSQGGGKVVEVEEVGEIATHGPSTEPSELQLPLDLDEHLSGIEKGLLLMALAESGGVKNKAAELLGLNFRSFRYRLKKYDLGKKAQ